MKTTDYINSKEFNEELENFEDALTYREADIRNAGRERFIAFLSQTIAKVKAEERERIKENIGQLRQWLNEDRITDPKKMVTNEQIEYMLSTSEGEEGRNMNHKEKVKLAKKLSGRHTRHFESPEWQAHKEAIARKVEKRELKSKKVL